MIDTRFSTSIHILAALAYNPGRLLCSEDIAESVRTNPSFIRKLLSSLAAAGLVVTVRGKAGGVRLASPPEKILLSEVYDAVTLPSRMSVPDRKPYKSCPVSCAMKGLLSGVSDGIESATRSYLERISLLDLIKPIVGSASRRS